MGLWVVLAIVIVAMGYFRLAPSDPTRWHVAPHASDNKDLPGGVVRIAQTGPDGLARLNAVAVETPRTSVLAGDVASGMVTYVTRSKLWGFPDYTTVQQDGDMLKIFGRLRFGRSDFGVNINRVDQWLKAIQPG